MGMTRDIMEGLQTIFTGIAWVKFVEFQKIRITAADFREHEIPVIQYMATSTTGTSEQGRIRAKMNVTVEVILKQQTSGAVDILDLYDKMEDVEQAIGANLNLNIPGVISITFGNSRPDIHIIEPFYIGELNFVVEFYKVYTGSC